MKKSAHYVGYAGPGLMLLVYCTHYVFAPIEPVFHLARHKLQETKPLFESVCFMVPLPDSSEVCVLFPARHPVLLGDEIEAMRRRWYANGDFRADYLGMSSE
jgi:hypothetical protein